MLDTKIKKWIKFHGKIKQEKVYEVLFNFSKLSAGVNPLKFMADDVRK